MNTRYYRHDNEHHNNPFKEENFSEEAQAPEQPQEEEVKEEVQQQETKQDSILQTELDDLNNKYLRLAADFDNYRKRQAQERESLLKYGAEETLKKLITVLDTFERAKESVKEIENCQTVKESYDVALKQLFDTLQKIGLEKIEAQGQEFDPNFHEAVMQTPSNEHPDNTVITQLQSGYKLGDRVLRPAMVNVAVNEDK